ncbi:hypothetical protein PVAND_007454 [Polypedilum vanderplanki]|uniref:Ionotropic receptor n=1 Tax=Polypedilum vanderplanki TaxID=319348 RepID=A0A9J6C6R0_POLVA|nr:hypothetical protein PVAND_007454 [Polypedilum vanderplanki]
MLEFSHLGLSIKGATEVHSGPFTFATSDRKDLIFKTAATAATAALISRLAVTLNQLEEKLLYYRKLNSYYFIDFRFFEFFIIKEQISIDLYANVLYSEETCEEFSQKLLNSFDIEKQKWNKELENFDHFSDFHGCMLSFVARQNWGPYWYVEDFRKFQKNSESFSKEIIEGKQNFYGLTHELATIAAKRNNFTTHYTVYFTEIYNSIANGRGHITGLKNYGAFKNFLVVLEVGKIDYKIEWQFTEPCGSIDFYYLITLNDLYTNYEKLLMPFDLTTWILLAITFFLTFLIIFGTHFCQKWVKTIIFGAGICSPAFNTLGVIFGIAQIKLPKESANRFALALFICFCLIFRCCYQSMLFEFMTSDMRKPLPTSLDDLRKMNYVVVIIDIYEKTYMEIFNKRESPIILTVKGLEFRSLYEDALEGRTTSKFAFFVENSAHAYLNQTFQKTLPIMENEKLTKMKGYAISSSFAFLGPFIDVIHHFIPMGITDHLIDHATWLLQRPIYVEESEKVKTLSLYDLEFGFVLWLASLSFPITCFLCEISIGVYRKIRKTIKELKIITIQKILYILIKEHNYGW